MDIKILVVDDEETIRIWIAKMLAKNKYDIDMAEDYLSAVKKLKGKTYDIVITDKNMPGDTKDMENGIRLLKFVKTQFPTTEVIMMTGFATIETAIEAMKLGAFDYITKPFKIEALNEKIKRIVEYRSFIDSTLNLQIYKNIHSELLELLQNQDNLPDDTVNQLLKNLGRRLDHLFGSQKEFESIIQIQNDALASIQAFAEELKKNIDTSDPAYELVQNILNESSRRIN